MKKLYLEEKWLRHSRKKQRKSLEKSRKTPENNFKTRQKNNKSIVNLERNQARIKAPANFSVIDNTEDMLEYFRNIDVCIENNNEIYLDMSEITEISVESILYMLSRMDYYKSRHSHVSIYGNSPSDINSKNKFEDSGFSKFVYTHSKSKRINSDVYSIKSDENVDPIIAKEVIDFSKEHLSNNKLLDSKGVYATLIECMANTQNHAYKNGHRSLTKWWLMAEYDKNNDSVKFAFLDNGLGIPNTIRKNFSEKIKELFLFEALKIKDSALILSSLHGDFRTKTKLKNRGKGLPRIYSFAKSGRIKNLNILSKEALIKCDENIQDTVIDLNGKFYGTLFTWTFQYEA